MERNRRNDACERGGIAARRFPPSSHRKPVPTGRRRLYSNRARRRASAPAGSGPRRSPAGRARPGLKRDHRGLSRLSESTLTSPRTVQRSRTTLGEEDGHHRRTRHNRTRNRARRRHLQPPPRRQARRRARTRRRPCLPVAPPPARLVREVLRRPRRALRPGNRQRLAGRRPGRAPGGMAGGRARPRRLQARHGRAPHRQGEQRPGPGAHARRGRRLHHGRPRPGRRDASRSRQGPPTAPRLPGAERMHLPP